MQDDHRETPLHLAALLCNLEIYQELIDAGADDSVRNQVTLKQLGKNPNEILKEKGIQPPISLQTKRLATKSYGEPSLRSDTEEGFFTKNAETILTIS